MAANESLSDDYVAQMLKQDAIDSSIKYSALGMNAFLPKRPTTTAPKPNTRFLRTIIRETDSHNAALLAKEAQESRARLRRLRQEGVEAVASPLDGRSKRGGVEDDEYKNSKRRRLDRNDDEARGRHHHEKQRRRSRSPRRRDHREEGREYRKRDGQRRDYESDSEEGSKHTHKHHHRSRRRRDRSVSDESGGEKHRDRHHIHRRRRRRSRSPSSKGEEDYRHKTSRKRRSPSRSPIRSPPRNDSSRPIANGAHDRAGSEQAGSDSDPLEAIVGPLPPRPEPKVRSRGRGTFASSSAMDTHFSATYDPKVDVHPNSESENDWDQALEALRDRQRWKQQGADRLRAAGFTEDEVSKWEKGGERREEDVRWARKGEGREWDRGKVVDEDGHVDVQAEWGRLKGT
ncbi:MAG: hypothetical protein M1819_006365 [Sarea resinae]|nr:MAG: hypothetical protein M1819_006365 [Sarea resinae]